MAAPVPHQHLLDKKKTLTDKLARLNAGEINAEVQEGDGRQDEAIARVEGQLRELNTAIAKAEKTSNPKQAPKA